MSNTKVPAGQVSCLLCRGFVSVMNGDKARFVDHIYSEHEVKHDQEVLLAVSVLTQREKLFLIKTAATRLEAIGKGREPDLTKSIIGGVQSVPEQNNSRGGRSQSVSTPGRKPASSQPSQILPSRLPSNISISKVDMSRPCNMCQIILPNPDALADHMNKNHFRGLNGLNIVAADSSRSSSKSQTFNKPPPTSTSPLLKSPPRRPVPTQPQPRPQAQAQPRNPPQSRNQSQSQSQTPSRNSTTPARVNQQARSRSQYHISTSKEPPSKVARTSTERGDTQKQPEGLKDTVAKDKGPVSKESKEDNLTENSIRKEVEGLQTLELLDNLVNFLNE